MATQTARATAKTATAKTATRSTTGSQESDQERTVRLSRERSEKFLKLAPKRMTKALKALKGVTQLGNRRAYTYTEDQVKAMRGALNDAMKNFDAAFGGADASGGEGFKFN